MSSRTIALRQSLCLSWPRAQRITGGFVRPIQNLPAGLLLSLLAGLLLLVPGSAAQAQSTRSFLTVLWSDHVSASPNPTATSPVIGVDADIDAFFVGYG